MQAINCASRINFCGNIDNNDTKNQILLKTNKISPDSIELSQNSNRPVSLFSKIKGFLTISPEKKFQNFIITAQQRINSSNENYKTIYNTSEKFLREAETLLNKVEDGDFNDNIRTYSTSFLGSTYRTIATVNQQGLIDKIIHAKDGKIKTVYDIKTPLKASEGSILTDFPKQNITADCYFYNKLSDELSNINLEYMKNVTNSAIEFTASYDTEHGGNKQVRNNIDNSPIEVFAEGIDDKTYLYWFNYGKSDKERVVCTHFEDDKVRTKYIKTDEYPLLKKYSPTQTFVQYENFDDRPKNKISILHPKFGVDDYSFDI